MTTNLLILGASGDLTNRLLLPGIGSLLEYEPGRDLRILGADRVDLGRDGFADRLAQALTRGGAPTDVAAEQRDRSDYFQVDVTDAAALGSAIQRVGDCDRLVLYFALPPAITEKACRALLSSHLPAHTHLAMEKPFGHDLPSARALNEVVARLVPESQTHRIDHFLGKSTVVDVIALRFANRLLQAAWSADQIEAIEIVYEEALALEGRAGYYDHAGALVDMIQSHLLQVLSIVAMEQPSRLDSRELRDAKTAVLRATRLWRDDAVTATRRARYTAGRIGDKDVPNYVDEPGVDAALDTETLAEITVEVSNQRWAGVPITLRSGKALGATRKQIVLTFADVRHLPRGLRGFDPKDRMVIGLDPGVMELHLTTNTADDPLALEQSVLTTELRKADLDAYGEVLAAILDGETMLSVRGDAAEECWRITDEVLDAWRAGKVPMEEYPAGSSGPESWRSRD